MLRFADGFDYYQDLLQVWSTMSVPSSGFPGSNNIQIFPTGGRNGGGAVKFKSASNIGACWATLNLPVNSVTLYTGFAVNIAYGTSTTDMEIFSWWDGGVQQVSLRVTSAGKFYFQRGGGLTSVVAVIGSTSSLGITFNAWHYLECLVTINASTGVASLHIDGVSALNQTGLNTNNSGTAQINKISTGLVGAASSYGSAITFLLDDVYVLDTTGSFNTSYLGDIKVQGLLPTGNGTTQNYTQNEASWPGASTQTYLGHQIKDSNGNIQVVTAVTSDSKTGASAPTWATGIGVTTTDNHVTWTCLGPSSHWLDVAQNPPEGSVAWQQSTNYIVGDAVWDSNGNLQQATAITGSGTSSASAPTWNLTIGGTTADNQVTWTLVGQGEDTYLSDATIGDIERFTYPTITASQVFAVCVTPRSRKDDSATRTIRGVTKSGSTLGDNGSDLALSTTYQYLLAFLESDPNTGVAWTGSGVNAAEFGVKTTN